MPRSLGHIVRANAQRYPDDVAFVIDDRETTFAQHGRRATRLANGLYRLGLRHQDRIAVLSQNGIGYLECYAAAELAGFVVATVNFRLAGPEVRHVVADAAPAAFVFEAAYADLVDGLRHELSGVRHFICIGDPPAWAIPLDALIDSGDEAETPCAAHADDLMHLIYTSGTTGRPKGVMRSHRAELLMAELMTTEVGVLADDRVQIMMPLFHVGARWLQLGAQLRGAPVVLHRRVDPAEIVAAIARHRVTVTHMAPTIVQRVLDHPGTRAADLASLRTIYYSAAPMPLPCLRHGLERLGQVFVQLYGMTEGAGTTLAKRHHRPDGPAGEARWLSSVGQASHDVELRIIDDAGRDCPIGQPGEVATRTPTRMSGYWNNSVATTEALRDDWYRTGDVGYLDEEGFLFLVDRKKDMIISGGENIYCGEVEQALATHPDVAEVAVFGQPDDDWGEVVVAAIVPRPGRSPAAADVIAHCATRIASYKKPRRIRFLDEMPRLTTGKIDKKQLRASHFDDAAAPLPAAWLVATKGTPA